VKHGWEGGRIDIEDDDIKSRGVKVRNFLFSPVTCAGAARFLKITGRLLRTYLPG
jgi:hypothetical protein